MRSLIIWVGVILLLLGVIAYSYELAAIPNPNPALSIPASNPYRHFSLPLIIAGGMLLIVGTFVPERMYPRIYKRKKDIADRF